MNTLMLYSTTSTATSPWVHSRMLIAPNPIGKMPFWVTSRPDRLRNWRGTQESTAMFASTVGPPRKPVLAATNSSPASSSSTIANRPWLSTGRDPAPDDRVEGHCVQGLMSDRLGVPEQVQQDDAAGGETQRAGHVEHGVPAGRTRGSLSILTLLETASSPV